MDNVFYTLYRNATSGFPIVEHDFDSVDAAVAYAAMFGILTYLVRRSLHKTTGYDRRRGMPMVWAK